MAQYLCVYLCVCVCVCVSSHLAQDTMGSGKPSAAQDNMAVWPASAVAFTSDCQTLMDGATGKEEGEKLNSERQTTNPTGTKSWQM